MLLIIKAKKKEKLLTVPLLASILSDATLVVPFCNVSHLQQENYNLMYYYEEQNFTLISLLSDPDSETVSLSSEASREHMITITSLYTRTVNLKN